MSLKQYKAMKVTVRRKPDGSALLPAFSTLPTIITAGMPASRYLDKHGLGWEKDQLGGHDDEVAGSPYGTQMIMVIAAPDFIDEAVAAFDDCEALAPAAAATLWESRITINEDEEIFDLKVVQSLAAKVTLGVALTAHQVNAINVLSDVPGITKNHHKVLADYAAKKGFDIIA